jgi:FtsP/CotA-like multicopper oxidase with cupredoxin domain
MSKTMSKKSGWLALVGLCIALMAGTASAADVYLAAKPFDMVMPDTTVVHMWGYEAYTDGTFTTVLSPASAPGPLITVPDVDSTLVIHLKNDLDEPTSIVIPNTYAPLNPVFFTDSQGRQRARAFTHETAPGDVGEYTWDNLRPGTFLYQSGSHPAVQVQMGLYGGVKKDFGVAQAYPGQPYDLEQIFFFSEIDYALHEAVVTGTYGHPPNTAYVTTINYKPRYYLVNGTQYSLSQTVLSGTGTERVLVRFLNAGYKYHSAQLLGPYLGIVAEDANPYPHELSQYEVFLSPGKTIDAVVTRPGPDTYRFMDRAMFPMVSAPVPDLNLDGLVSLFDVAILSDYLGGTIEQGYPPFIATLDSADLNLDGAVNSTDLILLILRTNTP